MFTDLSLKLAVGVGTLVGAIAVDDRLATAWDFFDEASGRVVLYAAAITASVTLWRKVIKPVRQMIGSWADAYEAVMHNTSRLENIEGDVREIKVRVGRLESSTAPGEAGA